MTTGIVYPLSAMPVYHIKDTGFRLSAKVLEELDNFDTQEERDVFLTKGVDVLELDSLKEAGYICKKYLDLYLKEICGYTETFIITNSWLTIHKKGSLGHQRHSHPNSIFSGCLYLDTGAEESSIVFHPKIRLSEEFNFSYRLYTKTLYNNDKFILPVQTGSIIIFPSNLNHSVLNHTSDKTRITLCFNTFVKDKFGMNEYASDIDLSNISCGNEPNQTNFKYE